MTTVFAPAAISPRLKPLKATGWLETILLFGIPATALYAAYHSLFLPLSPIRDCHWQKRA
jgi:hypothetical protein